MKTIILIMAAAFCLSAASVNAQDATQRRDTTGTTGVQQQRTQQPSQNYQKDMVKIQSSEVPDNLRTTLQDTQYKGWEKSTIYRSKNNDMYLIETKDESNRTKTHRFDNSGKAIKDDNDN